MQYEKRVVQNKDGSKRVEFYDENGEIDSFITIRDGEQTDGKYKKNPADGDDKKKEPPLKNDAGFVRIYRTNWHQVVTDSDKINLTITERAVLFSLLAFLDWNTNRVCDPFTKEPLSLNKLAAAIHIDRKVLGETIESLRSKDMVGVVDEEGRNRKYVILNPQIAYFGKYSENSEEQVTLFKDSNYKPKVTIIYRDAKQR